MRLQRRRFVCVGDAINVSVSRLLQEACHEHDVDYVHVSALAFAYDPASRLARGDLMYRASSGTAAQRTEQFLYAPGVATFYAGDDDRLFFVGVAQELLFGRAGLDVPALRCALITVNSAAREVHHSQPCVRRAI